MRKRKATSQNPALHAEEASRQGGVMAATRRRVTSTAVAVGDLASELADDLKLLRLAVGGAEDFADLPPVGLCRALVAAEGTARKIGEMVRPLLAAEGGSS